MERLDGLKGRIIGAELTSRPGRQIVYRLVEPHVDTPNSVEPLARLRSFFRERSGLLEDILVHHDTLMRGGQEGPLRFEALADILVEEERLRNSSHLNRERPITDFDTNSYFSA